MDPAIKFSQIDGRAQTGLRQIKALKGLAATRDPHSVSGNTQLNEFQAALTEIVGAFSDLVSEVQELRKEIDRNAGRF